MCARAYGCLQCLGVRFPESGIRERNRFARVDAGETMSPVRTLLTGSYP